ncbi:MAG: PepSY-associated TM helix domain-containing protein [Alphaproteobacteria bacterium]
MSFILITGTLAVFSHEMDWAVNSEMRVSPQPPGTPIAWGTMYESAKEAFPNGKLTGLMLGPDPWFAAQAVAQGPDGRLHRLWLNPYTGEYQGATGWLNIQRFLRSTHRHLMMPNAIGIPIVCAFSFLLIASMVTGLMVYKKFWRGFFRKPRFEQPVRTWTGDLHRLGALWSAWFLVLMALTGIWYLAEKSLGGAAPRFEAPPIAVEREGVLPAGFKGTDLDQAAEEAKSAYPSLDLKIVLLPRSAAGNLMFGGEADAILVRPTANAVWVDPTSLDVTGIQRGETLTAHQRLSELADPLHFGTWGGLITKIIWFLFGALLSGLSVTGMIIYGKRIGRAATRSVPAGHFAPATP